MNKKIFKNYLKKYLIRDDSDEENLPTQEAGHLQISKLDNRILKDQLIKDQILKNKILKDKILKNKIIKNNDLIVDNFTDEFGEDHFIDDDFEYIDENDSDISSE